MHLQHTERERDRWQVLRCSQDCTKLHLTSLTHDEARHLDSTAGKGLSAQSSRKSASVVLPKRCQCPAQAACVREASKHTGSSGVSLPFRVFPAKASHFTSTAILSLSRLAAATLASRPWEVVAKSCFSADLMSLVVMPAAQPTTP